MQILLEFDRWVDFGTFFICSEHSELDENDIFVWTEYLNIILTLNMHARKKGIGSSRLMEHSNVLWINK